LKNSRRPAPDATKANRPAKDGDRAIETFLAKATRRVKVKLLVNAINRVPKAIRPGKVTRPGKATNRVNPELS
jgi:hypothetical protein